MYFYKLFGSYLLGGAALYAIGYYILLNDNEHLAIALVLLLFGQIFTVAGAVLIAALLAYEGIQKLLERRRNAGNK